jgi:hypothetical protein
VLSSAVPGSSAVCGHRRHAGETTTACTGRRSMSG